MQRQRASAASRSGSRRARLRGQRRVGSRSQRFSSCTTAQPGMAGLDELGGRVDERAAPGVLAVHPLAERVVGGEQRAPPSPPARARRALSTCRRQRSSRAARYAATSASLEPNWS